MPRERGFSLIEMLVATGVATILMAVAVPAYTGYVQTSNRGDARSTLLQIGVEQQKWRAHHRSYATLNELEMEALSPGGHYTIAITDVSATTFTATATVHGGQVADKACSTLRLDQDGEVADTEEQRKCWGL